MLPPLNGPVQQLCRFRLCDVLFAQKSSPKSLCKCDKLALLLAQLDLWQHPKNVENILPRLCRFCNLMAAKHAYTVCDLLLKLTRPPSFRYWNCIKSLALKTSTCIIRAVSKCEPKKASLLPPLNGPVQQLCRFRLCDVLFAQKSSPKSLCKCDRLALLLVQLDLWHPPKNVENILPRLCRLCNTCIIRAASKCEPKKASLLPPLNGPVPTAVLLQTV